MGYFRQQLVMLAIFVGGLVVSTILCGLAQAHPYNAPQIGDLRSFNYTQVCGDSSSVVARNASHRTATFTLERNVNGKWVAANYGGNDGAIAYIDEKTYKGRATVTVKHGESFKLEHRQPRGDIGKYRLMSEWANGPTDRAVLAKWESHRPIGDCDATIV